MERLHHAVFQQPKILHYQLSWQLMVAFVSVLCTYTLTYAESNICNVELNPNGCSINGGDLPSQHDELTQSTSKTELNIKDAKNKISNEEEEDGNLVDTDEGCNEWASIGECEANPRYMLVECAKSCRALGYDLKIPEETFEGEPDWIREILDWVPIDDDESAFGEVQYAIPADADLARKLLTEMQRYMIEEVFTKDDFLEVREICINRDARCAQWSISGDCEKNRQYMSVHCAPVCSTCHLLDFDTRCPADPDSVDVFEKDGIHSMFENIIDNYTMYHPTIHTSPFMSVNNAFEENETEPAPWVITLDKFLTDEECAKLIEFGSTEGYERSADIGELQFDGTYGDDINDGRTSENAWCHEDCFNDPIISGIEKRMSQVVGIPNHNFEHMQILRYKIGQYYNPHHDFIEEDLEGRTGVRILTFFLYLSDVDEGGGTSFHDLDLTITPKKGKALIWPNALNYDPNVIDDRMGHAALPVIRGRKFAANVWIHSRDFRTQYDNGCS
mmetsp:Transcript_23125/g.26593  ORF Transcript_23125/g.26593 Transcript_23125/m.26593 type:complete len:503 (-) Transcript_23125:32-1540(-)